MASVSSTRFYLVLVFLSGALLGAVAHRLYTLNTVSAVVNPQPKSPDEYRKRYVAELKTRLTLDDRQVSELNRILDGTRERWKGLNERYQPEMKAIREEQTNAISALLSDAQKREYDAWRAEREARKRKSSTGGFHD